MEHRCGQTADTERQHHIAQLADRGKSQDAFDFALRQGNRRRKQGGKATQPGDDRHRARQYAENRKGSGHQIHAGHDHRRRMDQCRYRRRPFHRIRQPHMQRKLTGFGNRSGKQQQCHAGQQRRTVLLDIGRHFHRQFAKIQRTECDLQEQDPQQQTEIADPGRHERLLAGLSRRYFMEIPTDQQIRTKSHQFPEYEHLQEIRRDDHRQHRRGKQRHEGKKSGITGVIGHISRGVDQHQKRNQ